MNAVVKPKHPSFEHRYYVAAAVGILAIVFAGFARTYFLRGLFFHDSLPSLLQLHGAVMTAWFVLFFTQTCLIAAHRVAWHRRLGAAGVALALLVVMVVPTVIVEAQRRHIRLGHPQLAGMAFQLGIVLVFAILVSAAILLRRRSDWHKRLMLLAALLLLDAALARFISVYTTWTVDSSTVRNGFVLACIAVDTFRHRRLHPAFVIGGLLVIANDYVASWVAGTAAWAEFAAWVIR